MKESAGPSFDQRVADALERKQAIFRVETAERLHEIEEAKRHGVARSLKEWRVRSGSSKASSLA